MADDKLIGKEKADLSWTADNIAKTFMPMLTDRIYNKMSFDELGEKWGMSKDEAHRTIDRLFLDMKILFLHSVGL